MAVVTRANTPSNFYVLLMKRNEYFRKLISGTIAAFGVYWVWICFFPAVQELFSSEEFLMNLFFLLTIVPLMALPGILAIIFGLRLFHEYTILTLKWLVGVFYGYFAFHLSARMDYFLDDSPSHTIISNTAKICFSVLAVVLYVISTRLLARKISGEIIPYPFLLSRGIFTLIAWIIWLNLSEAIREVAPNIEGAQYLNTEPWDSITVIIPIIVAYLFFKIAVSKLEKAQQTAGKKVPRPTA